MWLALAGIGFAKKNRNLACCYMRKIISNNFKTSRRGRLTVCLDNFPLLLPSSASMDVASSGMTEEAEDDEGSTKTASVNSLSWTVVLPNGSGRQLTGVAVTKVSVVRFRGDIVKIATDVNRAP